MHQIIAPTLFQNKICRLPGIGTLVMVTHSAETDYVNNQIKSPAESIDFIAERKVEKVFNEFSAFSELLQKMLDENGFFLLQGIGTFTKDGAGIIQFAPITIDPIFTPTITAQRVIRPVATHAILVGDQETTNVEMTEYFNDKPLLKDQWWVWAIALAAVGISVLIFYYYQHGFKSVGNVNY